MNRAAEISQLTSSLVVPSIGAPNTPPNRRRAIQRAKEELAGEGWLIVLHGRGTFVARPAESGKD